MSGRVRHAGIVLLVYLLFVPPRLFGKLMLLLFVLLIQTQRRALIVFGNGRTFQDMMRVQGLAPRHEEGAMIDIFGGGTFVGP